MLRKRTRPEHSILVAHTDVPDNDFTVLFRDAGRRPGHLSAQGRRDLRLGGRPVVLQPDPAVQQRAPRLVVVGDPVAEPGSRCRSPTTCRWPTAPTKIVRAAYAKQAAHDWHEFVAFRGRELCPGGRLVVLTMALDERRRVRLPAAARRHGRHARRAGRPTVCSPTTRYTACACRPSGGARRTSWPRSRRRAASSGCPSSTSRSSTPRTDSGCSTRVDHDATAFGALWAAFVRASVFPTLATALAGGRNDPGHRSSSTGWRPASPSGWPPRPSRCRSRWPSWC